MISSNKLNTDFCHENLVLSEEYIQSKYIQLEPQIIASFNPEDGVTARERFFENDSLQCPENIYPKLSRENLKERIAKLDAFESELSLAEVDISEELKDAYLKGLVSYRKRYNFLMAAVNYNDADCDVSKDIAAKNFMALNIDIFNKPDQSTYDALISEKIETINIDLLEPDLIPILDDVTSIIGDKNEINADRFKPDDGLVYLMKKNTNILFEDFLKHIPNKKEFNAVEIKEVFNNIINNEFYGAADDWKVELNDKRMSIAVNTVKKTVFIPTRRKPVSRATLRGLIVHEIGVHMMRSVTGEQTGVGLLQIGMDGYTDTEEGVASLLEQSIEGEYTDSGVEPYITIGVAYFNELNFRETFDFRWKLKILEKASAGKKIDNSAIDKAKKWSYRQVQRVFRGSNDLPFFKDLAYYNGSVQMWKFAKENISNPRLFDKMLLEGKSDIFNKDHERLVYQSRTEEYSS